MLNKYLLLVNAVKHYLALLMFSILFFSETSWLQPTFDYLVLALGCTILCVSYLVSTVLASLNLRPKFPRILFSHQLFLTFALKQPFSQFALHLKTELLPYPFSRYNGGFGV